MKDDCFGFQNLGGRKKMCKCLTHMQCYHTNTCSFYKPKEQLKAELIKIHGTNDLYEIGKRYAAKKGVLNETV